MSELTQDRIQVCIDGFPLDPCPVISNISRNFNRTSSGKIIGCSYTIDIEGLLINKEGGIQDLLIKQKELAALLQCDCSLFQIKCGPEILFQTQIAQNSISFSGSENNWVYTIPYTINITSNQIDGFNCCSTENLSSQQESWSIQENPDCRVFAIDGVRSVRRFSITHSISASAIDQCPAPFDTNDSNTGEGHNIAREWVKNNLGFDTGMFFNSCGTSCITDFDLCDHVVTNESNPCEGSFSAVETWLLIESTGGFESLATEDFTVDINTSRDTRIKTVQIQGNIRGGEKSSLIDNCKVIEKDGFTAASEYWSLISGDLHNRAQTISECCLGPIPVSSSLSRSPKNGVLSYGYTFDTCKPCLEDIEGCRVLSEDISIQGTSPSDVYAEIQILGRPCPILQCLNIKTKGTKSIEARVVVDCGDLCYSDDAFHCPPIKQQIDNIVIDCYSRLTGIYSMVFTDNDNHSWNPKTGNYTRSVAFSYAECCSGTFID